MTETFVTVSFLNDLIIHSIYLRLFSSPKILRFEAVGSKMFWFLFAGFYYFSKHVLRIPDCSK